MTKSTKINNLRTERLLGYSAVVAIWIVTIVLALHAKNTLTLEHYHISRAGLRLILAILELPTLFIWFAILFAALSFYRYARQIKGSKESPGFRAIAYSLTAMLIGSIVGSVIGGIQTLASESASNPQLVKQHYIIVANYLAVITALATYGFLFQGSQSLLGSLKQRQSATKNYLKVLLPVALLGVLYVGLIFANSNRRMVTDPLKSPTFGLPDPLIILTVAVPYIVSWAIGLLALRGIYRYQAETPGIVYKYLFQGLTKGLTIVIVLTIILQILTQFSNSLSAASLGLILGIIAIIYIVLVLALLYVARAARRLNSIETLDMDVS